MRIDDAFRTVEYTKDSEEIMVILHMQEQGTQSEDAQIQAFCKTEDRSIQYIKTMTIFLKKSAEAAEEVEVLGGEQSLANLIDPRGMAIFGATMNDGQKAHLFGEMVAQINGALSDGSQSQEELALLTKQVVGMIPSALISDTEWVSGLYGAMDRAVTEQLVGDQKRSNIDADTLTAEAFEHLAEAASLLVQEDRRMQPLHQFLPLQRSK